MLLLLLIRYVMILWFPSKQLLIDSSLHHSGNFMDRLGYPYQAGNECESCPNECEDATMKSYKKKNINKRRRSILHKDGNPNHKKLKDVHIRSNMVS